MLPRLLPLSPFIPVRLQFSLRRLHSTIKPFQPSNSLRQTCLPLEPPRSLSSLINRPYSEISVMAPQLDGYFRRWIPSLPQELQWELAEAETNIGCGLEGR